MVIIGGAAAGYAAAEMLRREGFGGQVTIISADDALLATGAEPIRLELPGAELPQVRTLRSLSDCRELIARAKSGTRAVIVGASFIRLEVAAAFAAKITAAVLDRTAYYRGSAELFGI